MENPIIQQALDIPAEIQEPTKTVEDAPVELTGQQQANILRLWNESKSPPSLPELIKIAFDKAYDSRSKHGLLVRKFLASRQLKPKTTTNYIPKGKIELTEEQKVYVRKNARFMKISEMAQTLFQKPMLGATSQEGRTIMELIKDENIEQEVENVNDISDGEYKYPTTPTRVISRINKYVNKSGIDEDNLSNNQKRNIAALMGYLKNMRFRRQMNSYEKIEDRELFEDSFVRYTWDKGDLTEEEVDQYIVLATETIISTSILSRVEDLKKLLSHAVDEDDSKISMGLNEAMNVAQTEYNESIKRQQNLLKDLKVKRSDRLNKQIKESASILNLVQLWKEEESRKKLLKLAEKKKEALGKELDRLETMDQLKATIYGITREEILNN